MPEKTLRLRYYIEGAMQKTLKCKLSPDLPSNLTPYIASSSYKADEGSVKQNIVQMRIIHLLTTTISNFVNA